MLGYMHIDALVITFPMENINLHRILINTGNSTIFFSRGMKIYKAHSCNKLNNHPISVILWIFNDL